MTQLVAASTLFQCACLATMIDDGRFPEANGERILVLAASVHQPELGERIQDSLGFKSLASRFDRVVDLAELIWPRRPGQFKPRDEELSMWERLLRRYWDIDDSPLQLVVESIQVDPALALCRIFHAATVWVHSDGLMSYGPTRNPLPSLIADRLDGILYLDLVPGLQPQLLREHEPQAIAFDAARVKASIVELSDNTELPPIHRNRNGSMALVLGQYLSDLGILTPDEEDQLHRKMVAKAAARGARTCIFKPHPSAGPSATRALQQAASRHRVSLVVLDTPVLAEVLMEQLQPDMVISCFSTALATARFVYGIEALAVGTELLLERLSPYQNSNRIPVTIADAVFARGTPAPAAELPDTPLLHQLQPLVEAVSYCMQPETLRALRPAAAEYVAAAESSKQMRYFKRLRLAKLDLLDSAPVSGLKRRVPRKPKSGPSAVRRLLTTMIR
ncbi:alpha-2,8-polysialyltransferase family protein [Arthrobacter sp. I2-34]|uniref:Alpha-2,8-polysialyltransferase family protein n=1 Tax=Arthrobacter hankyongi TaxID=2904801 RepID=A0ABS9L6J0_9MICC|nr:alpha-2,8-polysialyltransferase family protein [Arthrobacter hankyongi]MCG2622250.1 alpha-2,8-polysialyltransferase family protein [Arthrobacter hankyongi]